MKTKEGCCICGKEINCLEVNPYWLFLRCPQHEEEAAAKEKKFLKLNPDWLKKAMEKTKKK